MNFSLFVQIKLVCKEFKENLLMLICLFFTSLPLSHDVKLYTDIVTLV